ncbi:MAG: ABC transporter substrate-binding protein [Bacillota bacterium]
MKKPLIIFLIISTFILFACGCSNHKKEAGEASSLPQNVIRVQVPVAPPSIPLVPLAREQNIEVSWYQKTDEALSKIIEDKVDISIIPVNSMAVLYNKGAGIQLGAVTTWGILYLMSCDPQVSEWEDLKGKTVAVGAMGFSPDLVFRTLLARHGLKPGEDINIIYGSSPEVAQMLSAKKISLAVLPEPLVTSVLAKDREIKIVMDLEQEWEKAFPQSLGLPQAGLAVSTRFIRENPDGWRQFYEKYAQSLASYVKNPEIIGPEEEKYIHLPAAVIRESLGRSNLKTKSALEARESVNSYLTLIHRVSPDAVGGTVPGAETGFYLQQNMDNQG